MKKKVKLIDIAIGSLAGAGVFGKLNWTFNSPWKQTDLVSTVGFGVASFIAGAIVSDKCTKWATETRETLSEFFSKRIVIERYASPKEGE